MVSKILKDYQHYIDSFELIPSRGGVFELEVGDTLVYSKKELGRHAEWSDVEGKLAELLKPS